MKKYIKPCLSVMLGLLSFLALNENLNAIWLNAVGMVLTHGVQVVVLDYLQLMAQFCS